MDFSAATNEITSFKHDPNDDYYAVVGCSEHSSAEQICTEFKLRACQLHPDKHPEDPHATEKFQRLHRAKQILSDPRSRALYDKWRNSGLSLPFEKWRAMSESVRTSMHWATRPNCGLMLTDVDKLPHDRAPKKVDEQNAHMQVREGHGEPYAFKVSTGTQPWSNQPPNDVVRKFRNFEI